MPFYQYPGQVMATGQYGYAPGWSPEEQKHPGNVAPIPSQPMQISTQSSMVPQNLVKDFMAIVKSGNIVDIENFIGEFCLI